MTISYTRDQGVLCLLWRWKGSLWKDVALELIVYLVLYYIISLTYRFGMSAQYRIIFEELVQYISNWSAVLPVTFVLGFYSSQIFSRWWAQFNAIPWPDKLAIYLNTAFPKDSDLNLRLRLVRYINASTAMVWMEVCPAMKNAGFSSIHDLISQNLLTEDEVAAIERATENSDNPKYYMPVVWFCSTISELLREGKLSPLMHCELMMHADSYRGLLATMTVYGWISTPLAYTQVVTLATYSYFLLALFSRQFIDNADSSKYSVDIGVPIFTILEYLVLVGWLKVAVLLMDPYSGNTDDDFEMIWTLDRNITITKEIVQTNRWNSQPDGLCPSYEQLESKDGNNLPNTRVKASTFTRNSTKPSKKQFAPLEIAKV